MGSDMAERADSRHASPLNTFLTQFCVTANWAGFTALETMSFRPTVHRPLDYREALDGKPDVRSHRVAVRECDAGAVVKK